MADISASLRLWSTTAGSNSPSGTTIIGAGLDDNLRQIQAVVRQFLASAGSDMASASTVDLSTADGLYVRITGTTPITSFGTEGAGIHYVLKFAGALTLTHNAASLILPGAQNITTAAGDVAIVFSEGSGNWRCISYTAAVGALPPGTLMDYAGSTAPSGWLECDGTTVSRTTYANLFTAISTNWGTGDGSTTFNVPDMRSRGRVGRGTGTVTSSGVNADVDTTADTLTVAANNTKWITGAQVTFTLASGTITGLVSGNTYFVIRTSSTLVSLASTLPLALAGTAIDMTAKSSPVWSITATLTARTLAEQGGEEGHAQTTGETPIKAHTHGLNGGSGGVPAFTGGAFTDQGTTGSAVRLTATDSKTDSTATAHNNMAPFAVTMAIIKI